MNNQEIVDPINYLNHFSMHDVWIENVILNFEQKIVELKISDLNWNYENSPDYVERPCSIVFFGVTEQFIDILNLEGVRIDGHPQKPTDLVWDLCSLRYYGRVGRVFGPSNGLILSMCFDFRAFIGFLLDFGRTYPVAFFVS